MSWIMGDADQPPRKRCKKSSPKRSLPKVDREAMGRAQIALLMSACELSTRIKDLSMLVDAVFEETEDERD